jgi:uncharacterized damage-inducible protein DinB
MPGLVPPVTDERDALMSYLAQQRDVLRIAAFGLTDEQASATPTASSLTVGGLIKHCAHVERYWMSMIAGRASRNDGEYEDNLRLLPGETLAAVLERYSAVARESDLVLTQVSDLGRAVPVPPGVPWFPDDVEAWSVRWVLLHLIQETARHAGHADIVRESIDGATAFPLMAAAEGWPATDWMTPWAPAGGRPGRGGGP